VNRRFATLLAATAVGAFGLAMPSHALPPGTENFNQSGDYAAQCQGSAQGDQLIFHAPTDLWPPNHKYYTDIWVEAIDGMGQNVTLNTDGTHNQYDGAGQEAAGSGNTADDIRANDADATTTSQSTPTHPAAMESGTGSVTTDWEARAERAGTIQDGRTYTLNGNAMFSDGTSCSGSVNIFVPHDMRPSNR